MAKVAHSWIGWHATKHDILRQVYIQMDLLNLGSLQPDLR